MTIFTKKSQKKVRDKAKNKTAGCVTRVLSPFKNSIFLLFSFSVKKKKRDYTEKNKNKRQKFWW